jgi:hypothetical protein
MDAIDVSRERATQLAGRLARKRVAVRSSFIVSMDPETPPPMTLMMRGGRGGEVKLKLLLSMLWVAVKEPYDVRQPARVWAELLGLDEPETRGAARVNAAVRRLVEGDFLQVEKRPGQASRLILREETGRGAAYTHPGSHWEKREGLALPKNAPRYTQLPTTLWTQGWMATLSTSAVAMLLVLLEQTRGKHYDDLWFSPSVAAKRYGLSETTRRKGIDELDTLGIITVDRVPVGRGSLSTIRRRNTYSIDLARLDERPEDKAKRVLAPRAGAQSNETDFAGLLEDMKRRQAAATAKKSVAVE